MRCVEERAGAGNDYALLAELLDDRFDRFNCLLHVCLPDVSSVNHTSRQDLLRSESFKDSVKLLWVSDKVNVNTVEVPEILKNINVVYNISEISCQNNLRALASQTAELIVCRLECSFGLARKIENQHWFVDLNSLGTFLFQLLQELPVDGQQLVEKCDGVDFLTTICLGELKEGYGAEEDGTSAVQ